MQLFQIESTELPSLYLLCSITCTIRYLLPAHIYRGERVRESETITVIRQTTMIMALARPPCVLDTIRSWCWSRRKTLQLCAARPISHPSNATGNRKKFFLCPNVIAIITDNLELFVEDEVLLLLSSSFRVRSCCRLIFSFRLCSRLVTMARLLWFTWIWTRVPCDPRRIAMGCFTNEFQNFPASRTQSWIYGGIKVRWSWDRLHSNRASCVCHMPIIHGIYSRPMNERRAPIDWQWTFVG